MAAELPNEAQGQGARLIFLGLKFLFSYFLGVKIFYLSFWVNNCNAIYFWVYFSGHEFVPLENKNFEQIKRKRVDLKIYLRNF